MSECVLRDEEEICVIMYICADFEVGEGGR